MTHGCLSLSSSPKHGARWSEVGSRKKEKKNCAVWKREHPGGDVYPRSRGITTVCAVVLLLPSVHWEQHWASAAAARLRECVCLCVRDWLRGRERERERRAQGPLRHQHCQQENARTITHVHVQMLLREILMFKNNLFLKTKWFHTELNCSVFPKPSNDFICNIILSAFRIRIPLIIKPSNYKQCQSPMFNPHIIAFLTQ